MKFKLFLSVILLHFFSIAYAQRTLIKGSVSDAGTGELLPGADIQVKGTSHGVRTDLKGNFSIPVSKDSVNVLIISYLGYQKSEVRVRQNAAFCSIKLEPVCLPPPKRPSISFLHDF